MITLHMLGFTLRYHQHQSALQEALVILGVPWWSEDPQDPRVVFMDEAGSLLLPDKEVRNVHVSHSPLRLSSSSITVSRQRHDQGSGPP